MLALRHVGVHLVWLAGELGTLLTQDHCVLETNIRE